jgi:hypothetical protein
MPPRGYKKARPLTSDDYASSIVLCQSAVGVLTVVAQKHQDLPCLLATLTFAEQVVEKLRERKAQVDPRQVGEGPPQGIPEGDRPGEE